MNTQIKRNNNKTTKIDRKMRESINLKVQDYKIEKV